MIDDPTNPENIQAVADTLAGLIEMARLKEGDGFQRLVYTGPRPTAKPTGPGDPYIKWLQRLSADELDQFMRLIQKMVDEHDGVLDWRPPRLPQS